MNPTHSTTDALLAAAILGAIAGEEKKEEPKKSMSKDAKTFATASREIFLALKAAGFDDHQAIRLTVAVITKQ